MRLADVGDEAPVGRRETVSSVIKLQQCCISSEGK